MSSFSKSTDLLLTRAQCVRISHLHRKGIRSDSIARNIDVPQNVVDEYIVQRFNNEPVPKSDVPRRGKSSNYSGVTEPSSKSGWALPAKTHREATKVTLPYLKFLDTKD